MSAVSEKSPALQELKAAKRMLAIKRANIDLLQFTQVTMPGVSDPGDVAQSRYKAARHHKVIAAALESVEKGDIKRLIITIPPRHGKSELASRRFPAWFVGRDPYRHMAFAAYNAEFAADFGRDVRAIMQSDSYGQVFPNAKLRKGSTASDRLQTEEGGLMVFVGALGSLTGRGADLLLIDDPVKDREQADSPTARNKLWDWFNDVAMTRLMDDKAAVVIIQTRWHEDDLVGRLTDPKNDSFVLEEAKQWKVINLPAIAMENDAMNREEGEPLWPERFNLEYLNDHKRRNPRGFSALYQGEPSPPDGIFFTSENIVTYMPNELPQGLRCYVSSDHAVSTKRGTDFTCLIPFGIDAVGNIWILPDVWWKKAGTDIVVNAMLKIMKDRKPIAWWAERGHITQSIGPFLKKRMREEETFCLIDEIVPSGDKEQRSQAIVGRMSMKMVMFPKFAPWYADALDQMLKFPAATHDDFVDAMSLIGLGLSKQISAPGPGKPKSTVKTGTLAWVKQSSKQNRLDQILEKSGKGW